ncbi:2-oxoglutarate ferredoxin oxidoreductase subunit alpha [Nannocystis exedens]|uniref:2-oxoglutarate ferredoxin oxidoreductase subunit alpha n=1 Tax=Nannocystis exedens TaxID=54 RepID=A0A1I1XKB1_9BACT|nr:2-oxoacid:acceptor oxidoreductase subunit alpha [Nannocystis exedens]PCC73356.1 2-oxoglutarate ferredoxin oxidoreductase subunit alpha [Nannocystis exedens]SFE07641.1 2-oxoglutarate ferredoxin oxidoreductase subunit alpha [Nannocystis exedens]
MDTFASTNSTSQRELIESVVIRFAGDSGDGMQLTGSQFSDTTALMGNDLSTLPDFPAEIRAPAGTTFGVSGFQVHFAAHDIMTPGDAPDVLVAMNPAALKVNLRDLKPGGLLVVNTGAFTAGNLKKAGYDKNPLEDSSLDGYRLLKIDITKHTLQSVESFGLGNKEAVRAKNMWTLGLMMWMFGRERESTAEWLRGKFAKNPNIAEANIAALNAGHVYGETAEMPQGIHAYEVPKARLQEGHYRNVTGNEATAWGLLTGGKLAGLELVLGSYPITPASTILHTLSNLRAYGITTFQAEDEIAAVCAAIGASYAGSLGITTTSGPGLALKTEAIGLAVSTELPLVVVDVQRGGPSTGLPTKTEQSDLLFAVYGRNGDCPLVVLAASTPGDCFTMAVEAVRLATKYMTPVILLTDGFLANSAEPWKIPDINSFEPFPVKHRTDPAGFHPFLRDPQTLARNWAIPGTPGLEHRIGGLEKNYDSGNISYDPDNHHKMVKVRAAKVAGVADDIPLQKIDQGDDSGDLLVVGWGSTYGAISSAVLGARKAGLKVSHAHIRYMHPMPKNLGEVLKRFKHVLVPEMNNGMLVKLLRSDYLVDARGLNKIAGQPFKIAEIEAEIRGLLASS